MTVAQILANKLVLVGPFAVPGGILVFSATFLITDLLGELWGKREAHTAVWAGFYGSIFLAAMVWMISVWPSPEYAVEGAAAWNTALALTPRIVLASLVSYLIVQHLDVWLFHALKRLTHGRHLWLRNNGSTMVSQALDAVLFSTIAFYGIQPLLPLILGTYAVRLGVMVIDTPFVYGVRHVAQRIRQKELQY